MGPCGRGIPVRTGRPIQRISGINSTKAAKINWKERNFISCSDSSPITEQRQAARRIPILFMQAGKQTIVARNLRLERISAWKRISLLTPTSFERLHTRQFQLARASVLRSRRRFSEKNRTQRTLCADSMPDSSGIIVNNDVFGRLVSVLFVRWKW